MEVWTLVVYLTQMISNEDLVGKARWLSTVGTWYGPDVDTNKFHQVNIPRRALGMGAPATASTYSTKRWHHYCVAFEKRLDLFIFAGHPKIKNIRAIIIRQPSMIGNVGRRRYEVPQADGKSLLSGLLSVGSGIATEHKGVTLSQ